MRTINISIFLFLSVLLFSCKEKLVRIYDDEGNLKQTKRYLEDDIWQVVTYYSDGTKKEEGKIKNDVRIGEWNEWYSDGVEKWNGIYVDGERDISVFQQSPNVLINNRVNILLVDTLNAVKVIIKGLHPNDAVYATDNGKIRACINDDSNDIYLIPERKGILRLMVYALAFREDLFIGEVVLDVK